MGFVKHGFLAAFGLAVMVGSVQSASAADAEAGEKVFRKCKACHTIEEGGKNRVGPNLHGVVGRAAGSVDGFKYSDVMKNSGLTWDEATLDEYLENPRKMLKGNKMAFPGLRKEEDRANVIAYLKSESM
jgi:cytochrome c